MVTGHHSYSRNSSACKALAEGRDQGGTPHPSISPSPQEPPKSGLDAQIYDEMRL